MDENDFIIGDNISIYNSIKPCKLTIKNDRFQEPYIFFSKQINVNTTGTKNPFNPPNLIHYKYVAFNDGKIFGKKARFNVLSIDANWNYPKTIYERLYFIADISIQEIPKDDLIQLKEFIERERLRNSLFCKTIYNAVIEELYLRKNNTDTKFFREINKIEDNEKKIRLIQSHKQSEYRQLLVSINGIKQKLNAPPNYYGHDGWTQGFNQNNHTKTNYRLKLDRLLKEKEEIERNFSVSTN